MCERERENEREKGGGGLGSEKDSGIESDQD